MNKTARIASLAAVALVAWTGSGCGKSGGGGKSAGSELFAGGIAPPGDLLKVKAGMTVDDVKKVLPTATPCARHSGSPCLEIPSGYSNLRFKIGFYSDLQTVSQIRLDSTTKGELFKLATTAWGPSKKNDRASSIFDESWRDDNTGYIVSGTATERDLEFKMFVPLNAAYFGAKPGVVGPWKGITFGMTRDQVNAKVPDAAAPKGGGSYSPMSGGPEGVSLEPKFGDDDKVNQLTLRFPADVGAMIEKAWGPGIRGGKVTSRLLTYWYDQAAGLRFIVDDSELLIEPFLTYEALLGASKDEFGLLPVAVNGKSRAEVLAHYTLPASSEDRIVVKLAHSKLSGEYVPPQISCKFDSDKAKCAFELRYGEQTSERDAMVALLKAKWGEAKMVTGDMHFLAGKTEIVVDDSMETLTVTIAP